MTLKTSYEEAKETIKSQVCRECGSDLTMIKSGDKGGYVIQCAKDLFHEGLKTPEGPEEGIKRGILPAGHTEADRPAMERMVALSGGVMDRYLAADGETGEALKPEFRAAIVAWAHMAGLHAELGHIMVMHSKPYVTVDGYWYRIRRTSRDVSVGVRPLRPEERLAEQLADGDYGYLAEAWERGQKLQETGMGIIRAAELAEKSKRDPGKLRWPVVSQHPQLMGRKRAEWQLLRKLDPLEWEAEVAP